MNPHQRQLKIIGLMCVKDESDIVGEVIEHHMSQGLDGILVCDNGSTDGTLDILKSYHGNGILEIYHYEKFYQDSIITELARIAYRNHEADWVLPIDADEFYTGINSFTVREVVSLLDNGKCFNVKIPRRMYWPTVYDNAELPVNSRFRYWSHQTNKKTIIKCAGTMTFGHGTHLAENGYRAIAMDHHNRHLVIKHYQYRSMNQLRKRLLKASDAWKYVFEIYDGGSCWDYLQKRFDKITPENVDEIATILWHERFLSSFEVRQRLANGSLRVDN